jgi:hypothetical protein
MAAAPELFCRLAMPDDFQSNARWVEATRMQTPSAIAEITNPRASTTSMPLLSMDR